MRCRWISESRDPFINMIISVLSQYLGVEEQQYICRDFELLVALILDLISAGCKLKV